MSQESIFRKSVRTVQNDGFGLFFKKIWEYLFHWVGLARLSAAPSTIKAIKRMDPNNRDIPTLMDFIFNSPGGIIRPSQIVSEITNLANIVKNLEPKTVMEIGTNRGGTLFLFSRLASPQATIVSVDLSMGEFGGGYPEWKTNFYKNFILPEQKINLLRANSHEAKTKEQVKAIFDKTPIDFLFIDGDHTYEGVKKDFELYAPLVRKGGVIALHDIALHPPEVGCDVDKFWNEIKKPDGKEFIENAHQHWAGIGVYIVS